MYDYQRQNSRMYSDSCYFRQQEKQQHMHHDKCCIQPEGEFPSCTSIAMAYVPFQQSIEMYDPCKALERGTVFICLDKPFLGGGCRC